MPLVPRNILKEYFMRGDRPTEGQFGSLLDSTANLVDDRYLIGLRTYDPSKAYVVGDTMIYNNALYQCIADTTGVFDPVKWNVIASLGAVVYSGIWNALTNNPSLSDGTGVKGYYYVVTVGATRDLGSGPIDFEISDWVIYNGSIWQKVDNSQAPVDAANVAFTPSGNITSTNVQDAIQELDTIKADKVSGATVNDIAILDASGNLVDSGKKTTDFLPSTTVAADVPFTPNGDITSTNVQGAIVEVRDDTDTKLSFKADKVIGATVDDLVKLDASGNLVDSGKKITDFLPSTTVAADIPFTPNGDITSTNVQGAIVEVRDDTDTKLSSKADKVSGSGINGHFAGLNSSGNLTDSTYSPSSFLASTTVAANIPFTPNGDISATNVQAAIVEVRDDTDTKLLAKLNLSGGTMTGAITLPGNPSSALQAAPKQYVDTMVPLAGGTMTGALILNANPSNVLGAATKQYVDSADALKADKVVGAVTDDIAILSSTGNLVDGGKKLSDYLSKTNTTSYTPTNDFHPATKIYVDNKVAAVPAQQKIVVMPFTFDTAYGTTSATFARIPAIQIIVPAAGDIFPGTTTITAQLYVDYLTQSASTTGEVGLTEWNFSGPAISLVGTAATLAATNNVWQKNTGPASFTLPGSKTYQVIARRTAGTGSSQVQVESATLVLTFS